MRPGLLVAAAVGVVGVLIAGYVIFGGQPATGAAISSGLADAGLIAEDCPLEYGATPAESSGITAVLLDRSRSTRVGGAAPDYAAGVRALVDEAVQRGDLVAVAGFDGSAATVRWSITSTAFSGDSNRVAVARRDILDCLQGRIEDTMHSRSESAGSDVIGALKSAETPLRAAPPGRRTLIVATDGLANVGCADINALPPAGDVQPVVDACSSELPQLPGTAVVMVGLGDTAAADARPDSRRLTWLEDLWRGLCSGIAADGCSVAAAPLQQRVDDGAPVDPAPDPAVVWPKIDPRSAGGVLRVSLPDRMLFDTGSDRLRPEAAQAIAQAVDQVSRASGTLIEVVGHADSRGNDEYNDLLSLARARRVAGLLQTEHGISAPARGAGEREPACSPETDSAGNPDPVAQQCNRRVEIVARVEGGG